MNGAGTLAYDLYHYHVFQLAILAPGKRTVTSLLRITGLSREQRFATCHRVLNRAVWDPPFLTVLAPSERYCHQRGRRHKRLP